MTLYARGITTREIQGHLEEMYRIEVSPALISTVADAVLDEVKAWAVAAAGHGVSIVYLDALVVKMRSEGRVDNVPCMSRFGITMKGYKEVLGVWTSANEGATFSPGLKLIYRASTEQEAERQLAELGLKLDKKYHSISALWRRDWEGIAPFFQFPGQIRKIVHHTTMDMKGLTLFSRHQLGHYALHNQSPGQESVLLHRPPCQSDTPA